MLDLKNSYTVSSVPKEAAALWYESFFSAISEKREVLSLWVVQSDKELEQLKDLLDFFCPQKKILMYPAWDCLPYDRIHPNNRIVSQRLETLYELQSIQDHKDIIVLTTPAALSQRVVPKEFIQNTSMVLKVKTTIDPNNIIDFLSKNGYQRVDIVRDIGEYSLRGGIIDIFPTGYNDPLRLDFFGDELESIRVFDAETQRSLNNIDILHFLPIREFILNPETIKNFRTQYRNIFGSVHRQDQLYETISEGRYYSGVEHWLSLFYDELVTIFDYIPKTSLIIFEDQIKESFKTRFELVQDYYQARKDFLSKAEAGQAYQPLPPNYLYILEDELREQLSQFEIFSISRFSHPDSENIYDFKAKSTLSYQKRLNAKQITSVFEGLKEDIKGARAQKKQILIVGYSSGSVERMKQLFHDHGMSFTRKINSWIETDAKDKAILFAILPMENGFQNDDVFLITEQDIFGERLVRKVKKTRKSEDVLGDISEIESGDFVVHQEHGIGKYHALVTLDVQGVRHDFLEVHYLNDDKLFIPVENVDVLAKFGSGDSFAQLDKLGGVNWQRRKAKVKEKIKNLAHKLIQLAAERKVQAMEKLVLDPALYQEFCSRFLYTETDDQQQAIDEVMSDLQSGNPMDRLVCGDVGFGKTEVALRAAFLTAMNGKQVALVVPTTLLCLQHFKEFVRRFDKFPVKVRQLSRFVSRKDIQKTKEDLKAGRVDIVVGTHALFAKDLSFADLGLLIVDEEQNFGVAQKEKLKELQSKTHVLTLTATPIPRTLQMSLTGVRELSIIATPPVDRLAVRTFIMPYDEVIIKEAIMREYFRGGQIFYVCPRLQDLPFLQEELNELVPDARVLIANGQMPSSKLESIISDFCEHKADILLSTNIVESGLDIPNANTIIIHRADMFGLAQLYQLRGRVGRSKTRAYAYLTTPKNKRLTASGEKRLEVMQKLDNLGAGFTLASYDMDIRGAGNLLGEEQSGHIKEVGVELYQQMLKEAIEVVKYGSVEAIDEGSWSPQINMGLPVYIPETYVNDLGVRLHLYRQAAKLKTDQEIEEFRVELIDRFGSPLPEECDNFLNILSLKQICLDIMVEKIDAGPKGFVVQFYQNKFPKPEALIAFLAKNQRLYKLRPDQKILYLGPWEEGQNRLSIVKNTLIAFQNLLSGVENQVSA